MRTSFKSVLNGFKMLEDFTEDAMNGDAMTKAQIGITYQAIMQAMDSFMSAALLAKTPEHKALVREEMKGSLDDLKRLIAETAVPASNTIIKMPTGGSKPEA